MQLATVAAALYFPASQSVQEDAPDEATEALYLPTPQPMQATDDVDPVLGLYFPAPQSVQVSFIPDTSLNLPAEQSSQAVPALFEALPVGQLKQDADCGQKFPLFVAPEADALVVPAESFTFHERSLLQQVPAVA